LKYDTVKIKLKINKTVYAGEYIVTGTMRSFDKWLNNLDEHKNAVNSGCCTLM